jgi:protoporphyrinogen oxidase
MNQKTAIIIGAGPAGLTAAYELLQKTDIKPVIYEMSNDIGGISKTVNYKGNRIDIGGHRFFSKSDRVMAWWLNILPLQEVSSDDGSASNNLDAKASKKNASKAAALESNHRVMLLRNRLSRIFFLRKFFDYPVSLNINTIKNLGMARLIRIGLSYIKVRLFPIKPEKSLEDFFINRFGKALYGTFFKDYTEKVWGIPCSHIQPEWGAQRIKGLSIGTALLHAAKNLVSRDRSFSQKDTETSLIEQFMYPKYGPGQMWEEVARIIREKGGVIHLNHRVTGVNTQGQRVKDVEITDQQSGKRMTVQGDYVFSTMPVKELIRAFQNEVPANVREVAEGLMYRDFITVGLLLNKLKIKNTTRIQTHNQLIPDNWIYIQERDVRLGRLQIFNNWSSWLVKDPDTVWMGLEYFCNEDDDLYTMPEEDFVRFAIDELVHIDIIEKEDVLDSVVIKMPKTYPAYFGSYDRFAEVRRFTDRFENLFLIGRNGQHRYNNMDHSMLTAMISVENIIDGIKTKDNIWAVNAEEEYHESK